MSDYDPMNDPKVARINGLTRSREYATGYRLTVDSTKIDKSRRKSNYADANVHESQTESYSIADRYSED